MPGVDITEAELKKAVAEIAALIEPPRLERGEITSLMLAEEKGITRRQAAYQLERAHERGQLSMREVKHDGRKVNAYSIIAPVTGTVTNGD